MPGSAELRYSQPTGWSSGKVKGQWARDPLGLGHSCACPEGGLSPAAPPLPHPLRHPKGCLLPALRGSAPFPFQQELAEPALAISNVPVPEEGRAAAELTGKTPA